MFIGPVLVSLFSTAALAAEPVDVYELDEKPFFVLEVSDPAAFVAEGFSLVASDEEEVTTHPCSVDVQSLSVDCDGLGTFPVTYQSDASGTAVAFSLEKLDGKVYIFGVASAHAQPVPKNPWNWWMFWQGTECAIETSDLEACREEATEQGVPEACEVMATAEWVRNTCVVTCHVGCSGGAWPDSIVLDALGG